MHMDIIHCLVYLSYSKKNWLGCLDSWRPFPMSYGWYYTTNIHTVVCKCGDTHTLLNTIVIHCPPKESDHLRNLRKWRLET
jgi:hypothetical protein